MNAGKKALAAAIAAAAREVPMPWLVQSEFPAKAAVKEAFRRAEELLPAWAPGQSSEYQDVVAKVLSIGHGTDPRGGPFRSQAIQASALLHEYAVKLLVELTEED